MDYRFYLDNLEIEEPLGFSDFELSLKRDEKYHGIQFEASTGALQYYGAAAEYLRTQKGTYGLKANVTFTAEVACDTEFEQVFQGRLNFGKYKDTCGTQCVVSIPVEEDSCKLVFKNRFDQKVDLDNGTAFDGLTPLEQYNALGIEIELPAKALQVGLDIRVADEGYVLDFIHGTAVPPGDPRLEFIMRPNYLTQVISNIATNQPEAIQNWDVSLGSDFPISPQLLLEEIIDCFSGGFPYVSRQKGVLVITDLVLPENIIKISHKVIRWDGNGNIFEDSISVAESVLFSGSMSTPVEFEFDDTISGTTTINEGEGFYDVIFVEAERGAPQPPSTVNLSFNVTWHKETTLSINAIKLCPDTPSDAYLVHEALSRVAESVTNNCIRVKSAYYGRIDSQPFAFDQDGCGGLRMLTSGLKIRRAPEDKFFVSPKDLIDGLNGIDNIGFSIDPDESNPGKFILKIEPVQEFYLDEEILVLDAIAEGNNEVQESMHYSKVNVGYKKWEVEGVNGLDEFNSTREYRTSLETVSNTLDITTNLVAGSYPIEITRQQSFAESGAADTKFDNDIFIITLIRNAYDFEVEQGNIDNAANFFDPDTVYNFRLSPVRNLMRWYKSIANSYVNIGSSENKLFFSAGTGNLAASGEIIEGAYDAACKLESMPISESQDLFITQFARESDYKPLWKNETFSAEYPLSVAEYNQLKENPYGYISYQCGNGDYEKGYIREVKFRPAKGMASFTLIKKWE